MAQLHRSTADDLRVQIDALTALERRTRLGQPDPVEGARIGAALGALFPPPAPRPVNPPLAVTRHGMMW